MSGPVTRVLVIDDSVPVRRAISRALEREPGVEVIAAMRNGPAAVMRSSVLRPDVVLLDAETDGAQNATLSDLRREQPSLRVVIRGEHDWRDESTVRRVLLPAIRGERRRRSGAPSPPPPPEGEAVARPPRPVRAIVVAASTGGPDALEATLSALPADLPAPVLVVQHMPAEFTGMLAERFDRRTALAVCEAQDAELPRDGHVYIAPGGRHLAVAASGEGPRLVVHDGPRENSCRPAADVLFRSAAAVYGAGLLAVVLTGMGSDGLAGARAVRAAGGRVVTQSEASAVIASMPGAVRRHGLADAVVDLGDLGAHVAALTRRGALA